MILNAFSMHSCLDVSVEGVFLGCTSVGSLDVFIFCLNVFRVQCEVGAV